jgi:membrane fusion protein, multidrug efflux system
MKKLILILVLLAACTGIYFLRNSPEEAGGKRGGRGEGQVAVLVASARKADVPVTLDAVGTVQSLNSVTVRAQIDGKLMKIAFSDGQDVKAGDVLALVDPTTAQALYDQAAAKKAQNMALLNNARLDSVRYKKLAQTEYGSRQQADTQASTVAQLEAQVRSDQASIDNYKAQLEFTTIRAPIDGRTGIRNVDAGNIIRASDANGLVVITQLKPMGLVFSLAQQNLRVVSGAMGKQILSVQVLDSDNISVLDTGTLTVVDNAVDQTTGTVKLKATFPNANLQLWPGQFVNVRLLVDTLKQVVVVPSSAVQRGPTGPYVYVLGEGDKVSLRPVTIGQQDEMNAVITSGLEAGLKVVTTGFTRLTDSAKVTATEASEQPVVEAVPLKKGGGRKRGEKEGGGVKPVESVK